MTKKVIFTLLLSFGLLSLQAQFKNTVYLAIGGGSGSHLSQVISSNVMTGLQGSAAFGYERRVQNIFRYNMDFGYSLLNQKEALGTTTTLLAPSINILWMKRILPGKPFNLYVGPELEGAFSVRRSINLGNNGISLFYSNSLSIASRIEKSLWNGNWQVGGELSLALVSWTKSSDSYAFSVPQKFLTAGKFNYDEDPNGFYKYGDIASINKYNRIKTNISLIRNAGRFLWGVHYDWKLRSANLIEGGKTVTASHAVRLVAGLQFGRNKTAEIKH